MGKARRPVIGFYRDKKGRTRPITSAKPRVRYKTIGRIEHEFDEPFPVESLEQMLSRYGITLVSATGDDSTDYYDYLVKVNGKPAGHITWDYGEPFPYAEFNKLVRSTGVKIHFDPAYRGTETFGYIVKCRR